MFSATACCAGGCANYTSDDCISTTRIPPADWPAQQLGATHATAAQHPAGVHNTVNETAQGRSSRHTDARSSRRLRAQLQYTHRSSPSSNTTANASLQPAPTWCLRFVLVSRRCDTEPGGNPSVASNDVYVCTAVPKKGPAATTFTAVQLVTYAPADHRPLGGLLLPALVSCSPSPSLQPSGPQDWSHLQRAPSCDDASSCRTRTLGSGGVDRDKM